MGGFPQQIPLEFPKGSGSSLLIWQYQELCDLFFRWLLRFFLFWVTTYVNFPINGKPNTLVLSLRHFKPLLREDSTYYGLNVLMRPGDGPRTRKGSRTNGLSGLMTSICWSINQQTLWDAKTRLLPIRKSGPKNLSLQLENIPVCQN